MKKILSILQVASMAPLATVSVVSCSSEKLDVDVSKILNYTDDKGDSNLEATPELKNGKFIYTISGYNSLASKVSNDDISDAKLKSFVEKKLKITKKEEFKDIVEEFDNVEFEIKVESNIIKFANGTANVTYKKGSSDIKKFKGIKIKNFNMDKAAIEGLFNQINDQDFNAKDLKGKASNTQVDFKAGSDAGKALKEFAKKIDKKLDIKIIKDDLTSSTIEISLKDLDAKKQITVQTP